MRRGCWTLRVTLGAREGAACEQSLEGEARGCRRGGLCRARGGPEGSGRLCELSQAGGVEEEGLAWLCVCGTLAALSLWR